MKKRRYRYISILSRFHLIYLSSSQTNVFHSSFHTKTYMYLYHETMMLYVCARRTLHWNNEIQKDITYRICALYDIIAYLRNIFKNTTQKWLSWLSLSGEHFSFSKIKMIINIIILLKYIIMKLIFLYVNSGKRIKKK